MRILAILPALTLIACASPNKEIETHLSVLDSHLDRLSLSIDALNAKVAQGPGPRAPAVAGITCRDGKLTEYAEGEQLRSGEKALGKLEKCAPPKDYAQCLDGMPASDVAGACAAGKLDVLLEKPKDKKS